MLPVPPPLHFSRSAPKSQQLVNKIVGLFVDNYQDVDSFREQLRNDIPYRETRSNIFNLRLLAATPAKRMPQDRNETLELCEELKGESLTPA
jgi:hypothetical protein